MIINVWKDSKVADQLVANGHEFNFVDRDNFPDGEMVVVGVGDIGKIVEQAVDSKRLLERLKKRPLVFVSAPNEGFYQLGVNHAVRCAFLASVVSSRDELSILAEALCPRQLTDNWSEVISRAVKRGVLNITNVNDIPGVDPEALKHQASCGACQARVQEGLELVSSVNKSLDSMGLSDLFGSLGFSVSLGDDNLPDFLKPPFGEDPFSNRGPGESTRRRRGFPFGGRG